MSASTRSGRVRGRPDPGRTQAGAPGCARSPPQTEGCRHVGHLSPAPTAVCGPARRSDAPWWSSLLASAPARGRPVLHRPHRAARLAGPPFTSTGRVLMRPRDGGIHTDIPGDQTSRVRAFLQAGQDPPPGSVSLPPPEQPIDRLPGPISCRHVPPRRTDPHPPADAIDQPASGPFRRTTWPLRPRQQRLQHRPLRVTQIEPPRHR